MYQSLKSKPIYGVFWNYLLIIFQNELYSQRKLLIWTWNKDGSLLNETSCNSFNFWTEIFVENWYLRYSKTISKTLKTWNAMHNPGMLTRIFRS